MNGCPSREQLADMAAGRATKVGGFDLHAHIRSCAACRSSLRSFSQGGMEHGPLKLDEGAVAAQAHGLSAADAGTLFDSGDTLDSSSGGPVPAEPRHVEAPVFARMPSSAPFNTPVAAAEPSSLDTVNSSYGPSPEEPASLDTIDSAFGPPAALARSEPSEVPSCASSSCRRA